jgi:hypothetical protein
MSGANASAIARSKLKLGHARSENKECSNIHSVAVHHTLRD